VIADSGKKQGRRQKSEEEEDLYIDSNRLIPKEEKELC
jgi:hypothetical protein